MNIKGILHGIVSVGANLLMFDVIPVPYKVWAILVFNVAQALYAFYDTSYAFQKFGNTLQK